MISPLVIEDLVLRKKTASFPSFPVKHLFTLLSAGNMSYSHGEDGVVEVNKEEVYNQFGVDNEEQEVVHAVPEHEDKIVRVDFGNTVEPVTGDAVITDVNDLSLEMAPADCYILIMSDKEADELSSKSLSTLAMMHIGRKNVHSELIEKTISRFDLDPESIQVALSPGIGKCCLKFSWFRALLESMKDPTGIIASEFSFEFPPEKVEVKLQERIVEKLLEADISMENITASRRCTACDFYYDEEGEEQFSFWSHRRFKKNGGKDGRGLVLAQN